MKGIVFNLLEAVVIQRYGEDTWDALLEAAESDGAFTSLGSYPDDVIMRLVAAASAALDESPADILRWFGRSAMPFLAERYPGFFSPHASTRSFILSLNQIIHPQVRSLYPGADVPTFDFSDGENGTLIMGYHSARKLCSLAEGFVEGAADHFGDVASFRQSQCMLHGDDKCVFHVSFARGAQA